MKRNNDRVWELPAALGPIILVVLGAYLALFPPDPTDATRKAIWIGGFIVAGMMTLIATMQANRAAERRAEERATGGDNYCFFRVAPADLKKSSAEYQLRLDATGTVYDINYWISPAAANLNADDPSYYSADHNTPLFPVVYEGPHVWNRTLPLGDYFVQFDGRNGHWIERLRLELSDGIVRQHIEVMDKNRKVRWQVDEP
jgi:hypothetical protein